MQHRIAGAACVPLPAMVISMFATAAMIGPSRQAKEAVCDRLARRGRRESSLSGQLSRTFT
jgi:hypothetical protein